MQLENSERKAIKKRDHGPEREDQKRGVLGEGSELTTRAKIRE